MAKNQNTYEKRRREVEKKMRAEDKRKRRQQKKDFDSRPASDEPNQDDTEPAEGAADTEATERPVRRL